MLLVNFDEEQFARRMPMASVSLGSHFEAFIDRQIESGRFQNASEVVRAGLRLLEDQELTRTEREAAVKAAIDRAFADPRPDINGKDALKRIEAQYAKDLKAVASGV
jgi:antitoxin ParD1/3/4